MKPEGGLAYSVCMVRAAFFLAWFLVLGTSLLLARLAVLQMEKGKPGW